MSEEEVARAEYAALLREMLLEMAAKGWEAREIGMTKDDALMLMAPVMEPLVQSMVRAVGRAS